MFRTFVGYSVLAVIGFVMLKLVLGVFGFAFSLLWQLLWLAALGFVFYLIIKVVSPNTARRIREVIRGEPKSTQE